ncbi:MAG: tRNA (guanosine(46)-N7)-methyltransferase TrmB [Cyclobacteriaceae bacterium]|nr:tRNA (guanosine(46)-N7)-methyltransferase TrmB [Cyclobacteriaceae bacterium]
MSRGKTKRFLDNLTRDNIFEPGKEGYEEIKGNWNDRFFKNDNPITLELACGRGEYTIGMSALFSEENFIGVDIKGDRLWKGSGIAIEENLHNAAFLRTQIQLLDKFFTPGEVQGVWIMFPDPRPKKRDEKRRLTHDKFLDMYKSIIKPGGLVRLKTDNADFFDYTLNVLQERKDIVDLNFTHDLYNSEFAHECFDIVTRYEKIFTTKGSVIKYLRFAFK